MKINRNTILKMAMPVLLTLLLFLFATGSTLAQGIPHNISPVIGSNGQPRPGATISFCQHPANAVPCTNFQNIYNDIGLSQLINQATNPIRTDGLGNVPAFYAAPGLYDYTISGTGITTPNGPYVINIAPATNSNNNWTGPNSFSQQITSTVATGTAPLSIASTTVVPNLNAQLHNGKTAPAGNIVGDSDTQTLSNKTLTGASSGNTVTLLCSSGPAAAITGNSSAQTFFSCTIPANAVANLKALRATAIWSHSTGTATVTYGLTLNGVACWPSNNTAATVGGLTQSANFIETGSTTGNVMTAQSFFSFTTTSLTGLSWTTGQTLAFTFNVANTDQVTPLFFLVELIQ